jgi:hypothetical protein
MLIDIPKLREPVIYSLAAALLFIAALKLDRLPDWARLASTATATIFAAAAFVSGWNWIASQFAARLDEINRAKVAGLAQAAGALRGLTGAQTDLVARYDVTAISMIVDEQMPVWMVRGLTREIPFVLVEEFLAKSVETYPYLFPIRNFGNEVYAAEITNLIKSKGWADPAAGIYSAKLTKPLEWVAERFGVEL